MDTFFTNTEGYNETTNKLLNMKIAPLFLDNKITLCLQVNDITNNDIIKKMKT